MRDTMQAQLLMIVHHKNLVFLVGYCDEGENKALIYEYMANGNLQQHLSGINKQYCFQGRFIYQSTYVNLSNEKHD